MAVTAHQKAVAERCGSGASTDTMTFPAIVGALSDAGFESYLVDFRRGVKIYYLPSGASVEMSSGEGGADIAAAFSPNHINAAVQEAQRQVAGYTYKGFCRKVTAAGCAGYIVSFSGRRALYFGRTGETHTEHFPPAA